MLTRPKYIPFKWIVPGLGLIAFFVFDWIGWRGPARFACPSTHFLPTTSEVLRCRNRGGFYTFQATGNEDSFWHFLTQHNSAHPDVELVPVKQNPTLFAFSRNSSANHSASVELQDGVLNYTWRNR